MEFIIDEYHEKILKYTDDSNLAYDLYEAAENEGRRKELVKWLARGWKATVEWDQDANIDDGEYISLTKGEKSMTL